MDEVSISGILFGTSFQPTWTIAFGVRGCLSRALGICSTVYKTLTPGKQKITAEFLLMFLIVESSITNVDGGGGHGDWPEVGQGGKAG